MGSIVAGLRLGDGWSSGCANAGTRSAGAHRIRRECKKPPRGGGFCGPGCCPGHWCAVSLRREDSPSLYAIGAAIPLSRPGLSAGWRLRGVDSAKAGRCPGRRCHLPRGAFPLSPGSRQRTGDLRTLHAQGVPALPRMSPLQGTHPQPGAASPRCTRGNVPRQKRLSNGVGG